MYKAFDYDEYNITLEFNSGIVFVHCNVMKYNKSILLRIRESTHLLGEWLSAIGLKEAYIYTTNGKFARIIGNYKTIDVIPYNDKFYEVMLWELV